MRKIYLAALFVLTACSIAVSNVSSSDATVRSGPSSLTPPFAVVGLTDQQNLVTFRSNSPRNVTPIGPVTGLAGDMRLIGIDFRVGNSTAYGVGDLGGIYTINLRDATTTKVSQLTVPLQGTRFDVDFNPAANRLRVVSDAGQNLRHNIDDPVGAPAIGVTVADTQLTTPPNTAPTPGVTGAAYTNNDIDPTTATTLFVLNPSVDQVAIQSPANAGTLAATGNLGVNADSDAGFDISTQPGSPSSGRGFAALQVNGTYSLYEIDLITGRATQAGAFPLDQQVTDLTTGI
jgi:hypothetical protein